ncbi:MAG: HNH endonuclease [Thermoleophilaceae bacterium]|nr:HNH endonuclease [Thermoleophilaceae bacterium]
MAARKLGQAYGDIVPLSVLRLGFFHEGTRHSFGSFQNGIYRPASFKGPAALSVLTAAPKPGKPRPYEDSYDPDTGLLTYHYRSGSIDQADNRALRAACTERVPVIYFQGIAPGQYMPMSPMNITHDDPATGTVLITAALPSADTGPEGVTSAPDLRAYALTEVKRRLHQQKFRVAVLQAYRQRCTVCSLKQAELVQAAHIVEDPEPEGIAAVVNGLALCAIHHLAYDRNLMGIDPNGEVHIASKLLDQVDGPMLREGLQGFHGRVIELPRKPVDRPDRERLEIRYERFKDAA